MSRVRAALVAAAVTGLLAWGAAACTAADGGGSNDWTVPQVGPARIDVDTPALRRQKRRAGVEPCPAATGAAAVRDGLPSLTLPCFGGGPWVHLAELRGPLVVNVWASWCGPCRTEMPILQGFHERYAGRVGVLGIGYQDPQTAEAMRLIQRTGVTYPLLADPQAALDGATPFPRLRALPFLALVDADGRVVHSQFVALRTGDQLAELVGEHLGVGP